MEISNTNLLVILTQLADHAYWPAYLRVVDRLPEKTAELRLVAFYIDHNELPTEEQLNSPENIIAAENFADNMRKELKLCFDRTFLLDCLDQRHIKKKASRESKEFLANCNNNYGNKSVAQWAAELNVSKAEVRRRFQSGTLGSV